MSSSLYYQHTVLGLAVCLYIFLKGWAFSGHKLSLISLWIPGAKHINSHRLDGKTFFIKKYFLNYLLHLALFDT